MILHAGGGEQSIGAGSVKKRTCLQLLHHADAGWVLRNLISCQDEAFVL